ncbi:hypothetical protein PISMIDRAFT_200632 [Pisolithus microcarpus 441]|uniref:Uncharacterized protein n=1 Tax=Pisolithus microcarpus 441 TaxID=765257 RepID=A0A0C9ZMN7_9AGAM|nr:hypothetical protein PISMIDRAFT_200632 [Pisolithus microcarpus 441]
MSSLSLCCALTQHDLPALMHSRSPHPTKRARLRTSQSWPQRSGMPSHLYLKFVVWPSLDNSPSQVRT